MVESHMMRLQGYTRKFMLDGRHQVNPSKLAARLGPKWCYMAVLQEPFPIKVEMGSWH